MARKKEGTGCLSFVERAGTELVMFVNVKTGEKLWIHSLDWLMEYWIIVLGMEPLLSDWMVFCFFSCGFMGMHILLSGYQPDMDLLVLLYHKVEKERSLLPIKIPPIA
ncbi:hypothetical protein SUGI_0332440 [Cryptomeria japonica]|nr:hypothetical protein SUGI_0332440 [Cryptomeria japonica]